MNKSWDGASPKEIKLENTLRIVRAFFGYLPCAGHCSKHFMHINSINPHNNLGERAPIL